MIPRDIVWIFSLLISTERVRSRQALKLGPGRAGQARRVSFLFSSTRNGGQGMGWLQNHYLIFLVHPSVLPQCCYQSLFKKALSKQHFTPTERNQNLPNAVPNWDKENYRWEPGLNFIDFCHRIHAIWQLPSLSLLLVCYWLILKSLLKGLQSYSFHLLN